MASPVTTAYRVTLAGFVQGIGLRPFVYRLARDNGIVGWTRNSGEGLDIHAEGAIEDIERFIGQLRELAPEGSCLQEFVPKQVMPTGHVDFQIVASVAAVARSARVPWDRAFCQTCLEEFRDPSDRRYAYPLLTCTSCGPRYSILETMPYDRHSTTMAKFPLCARCQTEYDSPKDRRFHAEATACPTCGPRLRFLATRGDESVREKASRDLDALVAGAAVLLSGGILALKGIGGFQWLCRADDEAAIARLRQCKRRPTKPLAIMVHSLDHAAKI
ncbi:MAG: Sua5/YciO/YrdC/YwlC family protein, partial [Planctomycetota bacterium]